jgi:hypothetical protein
MINEMIEKKLTENFEFIQGQVDTIKESAEYKPLDIKQISDLQRYSEIQRNIGQTLVAFKDYAI